MRGLLLLIEDCVFRNNTAATKGGAVSIQDGGIVREISRTTFSNNSAGDSSVEWSGGQGGAISIASQASLGLVRESIFTGSMAQKRGAPSGGAIYSVHNGESLLINVRFEANLPDDITIDNPKARIRMHGTNPVKVTGSVSGCEPGEHFNAPGWTPGDPVCSKCPRGRFMDETNDGSKAGNLHSSCKPCAAGKASDATGLASGSQCTD